jgi:hypothetical protein
MSETERVTHDDLETDVQSVAVEFDHLIWPDGRRRASVVDARQTLEV